MLRPRNLLLGSLLLVAGFYLYIAYDTDPISVENYNFPPTAENAPLTQREIDIRNGLEVEPLPEPAAAFYQNGTYESEAIYLLPNQGQYRLNVTATLQDEIITNIAVRISPESNNDEADAFVRNYRAQVVGQPIDTVEIVIEAAPLTTNAFLNTLRDIREQALSS